MLKRYKYATYVDIMYTNLQKIMAFGCVNLLLLCKTHPTQIPKDSTDQMENVPNIFLDQSNLPHCLHSSANFLNMLNLKTLFHHHSTSTFACNTYNPNPKQKVQYFSDGST